MEQPIRAWHIGEYGEIYAGRCDEDGIKQFIREECGDVDGQEQIDTLCEEIPQERLDVERDWVDGNGNKTRTTFRKEAEGCCELPMQINTAYN